MTELIREHQLNIMLFLCGGCGIMIMLLFITRFISKSRKKTLLLLEFMAFFLLWSDRLAYKYAGDPSTKGYIIVRVSNFIVFFLTSAVLFGFDMYLEDFLKTEGGMTVLPKRLKAVSFLSVLGMLLSVFSAYTGLYYYFDETNTYHRGDGFLIAYIIPVICPIMQYTVIRQYRKIFGKVIYLSLTLYIFVPVACGIIQIFIYGISIVNMAMVIVSVFLYIFNYIDVNNTVVRMHETEIRNMQGEQKHMQRLFDQTATAFVSAVEKKDDFVKGNSAKVAEYARRIAKQSGKSDEDCEKIYYAALLHDVGMIGIPDSVIKNGSNPARPDYKIMRQKPVIGKEILSSITEYPYLSQAAYYSHERYDGTGYPEGLSGEDIPEIARIVAVADAYVTMTTKKRYRDARPDFVAREAFVKGSGEKYDPVFADIMVSIIDADRNESPDEDSALTETAVSCGEYRDTVTGGMAVENAEKRIRFECTPTASAEDEFSAPSIILFDSYDDRIHKDEKTIKEYHYFEYGEFWFDDHMISTGIRKTEDFPGWEIWKERNKQGMECEVTIERSGSIITAKTENEGIEIKCTLTVDADDKVYAALTGDQVALTDIRIM